jgi:phosphatidate cytidylyltransferase
VTSPPPGGDVRSPRSAGELALRVASALVLAPLAAGVAYLGGWLFTLMWVLAGAGVLWEWATLSLGGGRAWVFALGVAVFIAAAALIATGSPGLALLLLVIGALAAALLSPGTRGWAAAGIVYAGTLVVAPILLRGQDSLGFTAVVLLFAIVWATDIAAYFVGRAIGGPKLWPAVSPKKTWSGGLGGTLVAFLCALAVAHLAGLPNLMAIGLLAVVLSVVSQAGDFLESAIKRHFGAKDAGALIPGHGGLMDRLDGFIVAVALAALIGIARGGLEAPSRGLLIW